MSQQMPETDEDDNVLPLPTAESGLNKQRAESAAAQVRRQLHLLQGYVDLMDGLSTQQNIRILKVIAMKVTQLTEGLRPFLEDGSSPNSRKLSDYREARRRNHELMSEFRMLVDKLKRQVEQAQENLPPPADLHAI